MVKVIVVLWIALGFSGCATTQISVQEPCGMERPTRVTPKEAMCSGIKNTKDRELCTSKKYLSLEKDWDALEVYIDACIR